MKRVISLQDILFFASIILSGRLINDGFQKVFIHYPDGTLVFAVLGFFGFAVYALTGIFFGEQRQERWKFWIIIATFCAMFGWLWSQQVVYRQAGIEATGYNDGVVQTMEADRFLFRGVNPYSADYHQTNFRFFFSPVGPNADNVASLHYAYPPLVFMLMAPATWLHDHWTTWIDPESISTLYFVVLAAFLIWIQKNWRAKTLIAILTLGNPVLWLYALSGFNDFLYVLMLVITAWLMIRSAWRWAGVAFGLAMASKQTAWLTAFPLLIAFFWWWRDRVVDRSSLWRFVSATAITSVVIFGPFLIWQPGDLWSDLVVYVSGSIPLSYPISGWSLLQYLRTWGVIDSPWSYVPTGVFQAFAAVPILGLSSILLRRLPTAVSWLFVSSLLILGVTLLSRAGSDNYYIALVALVTSTYAIQLSTDPEPQSV